MNSGNVVRAGNGLGTFREQLKYVSRKMFDAVDGFGTTGNGNKENAGPNNPRREFRVKWRTHHMIGRRLLSDDDERFQVPINL